MSAWGANAKSCKSLLDRVEQNDPRLAELFILPTKTFGGPEMDRLAQIIGDGKNTQLKVLSASGHKVPNEAFYKLGIALAKASANNTTSLQSIAIGDHAMGHTGILALTKGLAESGNGVILNTLVSVDLSWKGLTFASLQLILNSFDKNNCPYLRHLNVQRNEKIGTTMSDDDTKDFCSFGSISHVEDLNLSQCGLSGSFMAKFFACLGETTNGESQATTTNLKKLDLHDNPLGTEGLQSVLPLLTNSLLEELNLSKCQINDESIGCLLSSDSAPTERSGGGHLLSLDLSHNNITSVGVAHLAEALKQSTGCLSKLEELNLSGNNLGEDGVTALAKALADRHAMNELIPIQKLDLTNTQCGTQGALDMLALSKLQSLHLFNNNLGSEGLMALAPNLRGGHATLQLLDVGGNGANQAAVVAMLSALLETSELAEKNRLKVVIVGGNEAGPALEQMVQQIQKVHPGMDIARDKKGKQKQ